jgi:exonuclease SbcC
LQGRADQFTQQRPSERKRILGSILGLEIWETYRLGTAEKRKAVETEIAGLDARLQDIQAELGEEAGRRARLKTLQTDLERLAKDREAQEKMLEGVRRIVEQLNEQRRWLEARRRQLDGAAARLKEQEDRLEDRRKERENFQRIIVRAPEIEAAFKAWQQARADIEYWDDLARNFREGEKRRQGPLDEINTARGHLNSELQTLQRQKAQAEAARAETAGLEAQLKEISQALLQAEQQIEQRSSLETEIQELQQRRANAAAENERLEKDMRELKARIDQLKTAEWAECPLCGQATTPGTRQAHIGELEARGKEMGDRYRTNLAVLKEAEAALLDRRAQLANLGRVEAGYRQHSQAQAQVSSRIEVLEKQAKDWEEDGLQRLGEVNRSLEEESFALEARTRLAEIDAELRLIGYDAAAHDRARKAELEGRSSDVEMRNLDRAQAALAPVQREIDELEKGIGGQRTEVQQLQSEYDEAAAALAAAEAQAPDLLAVERELQDLMERENLLRMEVGAARQKVEVLADLRNRQKGLHSRREELAQRVSQFKQLERAFSKDGVPALLIEQALPQIESRANEILDRLSDGAMSVRFITQASYKDKKREDLRETLDIQISDSAGARDYEMFSGGEAFRVNFAVRLALSEVLAQRAGARLQTLVIDEGFGSQDSQGRQRLIEAINLVRPDFAKILVITHIDELKDAFPNRIEVEKTPRGSRVRVV